MSYYSYYCDFTLKKTLVIDDTRHNDPDDVTVMSSGPSQPGRSGSTVITDKTKQCGV